MTAPPTVFVKSHPTPPQDWVHASGWRNLLLRCNGIELDLGRSHASVKIPQPQDPDILKLFKFKHYPWKRLMVVVLLAAVAGLGVVAMQQAGWLFLSTHHHLIWIGALLGLLLTVTVAPWVVEHYSYKTVHVQARTHAYIQELQAQGLDARISAFLAYHFNEGIQDLCDSSRLMEKVQLPILFSPKLHDPKISLQGKIYWLSASATITTQNTEDPSGTYAFEATGSITLDPSPLASKPGDVYHHLEQLVQSPSLAKRMVSHSHVRFTLPAAKAGQDDLRQAAVAAIQALGYQPPPPPAFPQRAVSAPAVMTSAPEDARGLRGPAFGLRV